MEGDKGTRAAGIGSAPSSSQCPCRETQLPVPPLPALGVAAPLMFGVTRAGAERGPPLHAPEGTSIRIWLWRTSRAESDGGGNSCSAVPSCATSSRGGAVTRPGLPRLATPSRLV